LFVLVEAWEPLGDKEMSYRAFSKIGRRRLGNR
jgi:hypothetical protein